MDDTFQMLNAVYELLHQLALRCGNFLESKGIKASLGYYNMHEIMVNEQYCTAYFPLPVLTFDYDNISCDLGINLEQQLWIELTVSKEKALQIPYQEWKTGFVVEIYGCENYLVKLNTNVNSTLEIYRIIQESDETMFHIGIDIGAYDEDVLNNFIKLLVGF